MIDDGYFVLCSTRMSKIVRRIDGIVFGTKYCCYIIWSNASYYNILKDLNYCIHCVQTSKTLDKNNEFERIYDPKKYDDYVSAFEKDGDEYDVSSAAKTILNIACNTVSWNYW